VVSMENVTVSVAEVEIVALAKIVGSTALLRLSHNTELSVHPFRRRCTVAVKGAVACPSMEWANKVNVAEWTTAESGRLPNFRTMRVRYPPEVPRRRLGLAPVVAGSRSVVAARARNTLSTTWPALAPGSRGNCFCRPHPRNKDGRRKHRTRGERRWYVIGRSSYPEGI